MATLTIAGQHQAAGIHEIRKAAFEAYAAGTALTSIQATICRAAALGLYAGPDESGIWWVQCRDGWATGATQSAVDSYSRICLQEVSLITTAEPAAEFSDLVIARARWAGLNFFKVRAIEPGSLMFATPPTWAYEFDYFLTCGLPAVNFHARAMHPQKVKEALDLLGVPASV